MNLLHLNFRQRIFALVWLRRLLWLLPVVMVLRWQTWPFLAILTVVLVLLLGAALKAWEQSLRRRFIREAELPRFLAAKIRAAHPGLSVRDTDLVLHGLRQFFLAHLRSGRQFVGMPSKVVDTAWHEFILHTQGYQRWCDAAFGRLLHHTPAEVLGRDAKRNDGLRRTWYWACKEESIAPRQPSRLPLLFALDTKLGIAGGFHYVPDCSATARHDGSGAHCGSSFGDSSSGSGDAGGLGGSDASSSGDASSGDGGCGGGCGGGGGD